MDQARNRHVALLPKGIIHTAQRKMYFLWIGITLTSQGIYWIRNIHQ